MIQKNRKILILFSSSALGGAEISLSRMAFHKSKLFEYQLATMSCNGDWSEFCIRNKANPKIYGSTNSKVKLFGFQLESLANLFKDIISSEYSIIYVLGFRASILVRFIKLFTKKFKIVIGIRWNPNSKKILDKIFRILESYLFLTSNHYICNSKAAYNTMIKMQPKLKTRVSIIYNGINIPKKDNKPISSKINYIIFPANIYKSKGHIEFLDIIEDVTNDFSNVKFLIAGKDNLRGELKSLIKIKKLEKFIEILGFCKNLDELMTKSRFMVLPSLSEGCPTSILEAFANRIPVIAYSIDGIPELIKNNSDGFLINPFNKKEFKFKILYLLNNPEIAMNMGERGRAKVESLFTINKCAINHETLFEKLLNKE